MLATGRHSLMFIMFQSHARHPSTMPAFYLSLCSMNFFEGGSLKVLSRIVYEPSHGIKSQTNISFSKNRFSMTEFESRLHFKESTKIIFRDLLIFYFINFYVSSYDPNN